MLVIQPTDDGRLHVHNNHRSDFVRDEASARAMAYHWGHTDVSINKALAEMRPTGGVEAPVRAWRIARPGKPTVRVEPMKQTPETSTEPAAKPVKPKRPRGTAVPGEAAVAAPAPAPAPAEAAIVETKLAKAKRRVRKAAAPLSEPKAERNPAPKPADTADTTARSRALTLFRTGVRELVAMESETLPFARGPWSDLREMAEYIAACLEGKRPKTGWTREGK